MCVKKIVRVGRGGGVTQNRRNSLSCTVWTSIFHTKVVQSKGWLLSVMVVDLKTLYLVKLSGPWGRSHFLGVNNIGSREESKVAGFYIFSYIQVMI